MSRTIKYAILVLMIVLFSKPVLSQEKEKTKMKWYSIEEAVELNNHTRKKKKFFVDVFTDWCGWCKKMDANTFTDPVIAAYMTEHFWPVKLDAETKDTITINGQVYVNPRPDARRSSHQLAIAILNRRMSYPSFAFLDENVKLITVLPGYNPPEKLEPVLHFIAEEAYKEESFQDFLQTFQGSFNK